MGKKRSISKLVLYTDPSSGRAHIGLKGMKSGQGEPLSSSPAYNVKIYPLNNQRNWRWAR